MRSLAACVLTLGLAISPVMAATGNGADKDPGTTTANSSASPTTTAAPAAAPKAEASSSDVSAQLQQLRDLLEAQAKQLQDQQQKMLMLEEQLNAATAARENPAATPAASDSVSGAPASTSAIAASASLTNAGSSSNQEGGLPTSIMFKGITLTPGGFMAAESVWRQKGLTSDVNTPFNAAPFNGSPNAHLSEWQASGRQSRISLLAEGKLSNVKIGGYYEMDFLSAGTTSTPTQSNSYTMRQRQFFAQAAFTNGITFTGGQQWSLLTETTHGMDNRTEALPMTIDANYNVGFSWARQFGARVTKDFGDKFWLGFSIEQSTPTVTVHGNPTVVCSPANPQVAGSVNTCPSGFNGTLVEVPTETAGVPTTGTAVVNAATFNNFVFGSFGASSGLYNPLGNYGYNEAPDFIVKAVWEPGFGHYEVFGIVGAVHDRTYPCVPEVSADTVGVGCPAGITSPSSTAGAFNNSATTAGIGGNARWNLLAKKVDVGVHFLGGAGTGRYGSGSLADLTVRPDGTVVPIHNFQALGTLQLHPISKLDIYMNVGGEYDERTGYLKSTDMTDAAGNEGYGYTTINNSGCWTETLPIAAPATSSNLGIPTGVGGSTGFIPGALGSCTGDNRNIIEGTFGFWYRFYNGPKGRFQYGMQFSNWIRNTWRGAGTATGIGSSGQPHSDDNMVLTSFRYYLP